MGVTLTGSYYTEARGDRSPRDPRKLPWDTEEPHIATLPTPDDHIRKQRSYRRPWWPGNLLRAPGTDTGSTRSRSCQ